MDGKALLIAALLALATNGLVAKRSETGKDKSYVSSTETTYIWKYLGIRLIVTHGQVGEGPPYTGNWRRQSFREDGSLHVVVHTATFATIDAASIAKLAEDAFATVTRIAGKPPIRKIELYLTPPGTSYAISHRSWAIGSNNSVAYVVSPLDGGYEHNVSRTVAHELFHTWVGLDQRSQMDNELGAATIENCAELNAFGYARQLDKSPVDNTDLNQLAGSSPVARYTLMARYAADPQLDDLFINGEIRRGTPQASALMTLCRERARHALHD